MIGEGALERGAVAHVDVDAEGRAEAKVPDLLGRDAVVAVARYVSR